MEELENIKKQFDDLMAKVEEIVKKHKKAEEKDEASKRWRAEPNENYYYFESDFSVHIGIEDYWECDGRRYESGNYFQTEKEAEKVAQHFKDYLTLRADAKGFEPKNVLKKFYIWWSPSDERLKTYDDSGCLSGTIYFETDEDAEASIAKHGDIWKRYLGVR